MNIEHGLSLSWFRRKGESHEQDGERLSRAALAPSKTASGDPAMAFDLPSILPGLARLRFAAASLPDLVAEAFAIRWERASSPRASF
jgi:hypothetical protein